MQGPFTQGETKWFPSWLNVRAAVMQGCTAAQTGRYLGLTNLAEIFGQLLGSALEAQLLRRQVGLRRVRTLQIVLGATGSGACLTLFALARSPVAATCWNVAHKLFGACLHNPGLVGNYLEVRH